MAADSADLNDIENTIHAWTAKLASGDFEHWINHWTEDAVLIAPDAPPISGHAALLARAKDFPLTDTFEFTNGSVEIDGHLAVVTNSLNWGGQTFNQVIVLRKQDDSWKVRTVIFNPGLANPS